MSRQALTVSARELLARRAGRASERHIPQRGADAAPAPLSPAQLPHWTFAERNPRSPVLNLPKQLRLVGRLDVAALARALDRIVLHHEPLRTVVRVHQGVPRQLVLPHLPCAVERVDLRALPPLERDQACARCLDEDARKPFDLGRDVLLRPLLVQLGDDVHALQVTFHHLAFDGWSTHLFFEALAAHYAAFTGATAAARSKAAPPIRFSDFAAWEADRAAGAERRATLEDWRARMAGADTTLDLGKDHPAPETPTYRAHTAQRELAPEVRAALDRLASSEGVTGFTIVAAALQLLLARRCGAPDPILGVVTAARHRAELESLIGTFMLTLPLRAPPRWGRSFRAYLHEVNTAWRACMAHGDVALVEHASEVFPDWSPSRGPLFQVLLNYRNLPAATPSLAGLEVGPLRTPALGTTVDLHFSVVGTPDGTRLELIGAADSFTRDGVVRWLDGLTTMLGSIASDADGDLEALPILPAAERERVLTAWNDTAAPIPDRLAHDALADRAAASPDDVALEHGDQSMSYAALWLQARAFAAELVSLGVGPGTRVGLCGERSFELVIATFAILEAGAALVALDPAWPAARLAAIAADAGLMALVAPPECVALVGVGSGASAWPRPARRRDEHVPDRSTPRAGPRDLAWIAYTSGTTGTPKGCMVEHQSVINLIADRRERLEMSPDSRLLQVAALGFEGVFDMLLAAAVGCRLVLANADELMDPVACRALLRRHHITHASFTPAMLAGLTPVDVPALRALTIGGEAAGRALYLAWRSGERRVWNEYGPTECTVWCALEEVLAEHALVGVGRAVANTRLYILDARMEPVPIGVVGELWVAGCAVGRGYHGRPELTAERFGPDPFRPGERMYRTGDRARWLARGSVEIVGRVDRQLKIRGQRVEPAEIEALLRAHDGVVDAAVTAVPRDGPTLVAYYTTDDARPRASAALRRGLRRQLPAAMWPQAFVHLEAMPLTSNGKVDLARLPDPPTETSPPSPTAEAALVREPPLDSPFVTMVADAWREVLPGRAFGLDDDFVDVGGHSLLAARMLHEVARTTGVELPLSTVLAGATIRSVAAAVVAGVARRQTCECVTVQAGEPEPIPFFMLHGDVAGAAAYCRRIARALGPAVPVYGLAPPSQALASRCPSIEAVADLLLAAIRRVRPRGPYRIGGYCVSGLVAYEIACRLKRAGEVVDLLVLADTRPWVLPGLHTALAQRVIHALVQDPARRREWVSRLLPHLQQVTERSPLAALAYLARGLRRVGRRRSQAGASETPTPWWVTFGRLRLSYVPPALEGRLDLVWSADQGPRGHAERWRSLVDVLSLSEVSSSHEAIVWRDLPDFVASAYARAERDHPRA
jgi:amino acid adenylation domain-containing protein